MFVLLTAAVVLLRGKGRFFLIQIPPLLRFAIVILVISYLASLWTGLVPLEPIDANAFANYFSRYNSLRVAKGFFWAIVLFLVVPAGTASGELDPRRLLSVGMILGLVGVNCAVLYERFKFAGLFTSAPIIGRLRLSPVCTTAATISKLISCWRCRLFCIGHSRDAR